MKLSEKTVLKLMYAFIGILLAGVLIAVIITENRDRGERPQASATVNIGRDTSAPVETVPGPSDSVSEPDAADTSSMTPVTDTLPAEASSEASTTAPATSAVVITTDAPTEATTSAPVPTVPFSIYVHEPKSKIWTKADVYTSRWPANDSDVGRDAQGNYKAWTTGYWTRDWWSFSGVTNLICDTTYFFVIPSDAEIVTFSTTYGTNTWAKEWAALWKDAGLEGAKIGYKIERVMKDGTSHSMTVLDPSHTFEEQPYYENYLYDEVHRPDASHVTTGVMNKDTILTDIKITLRNGCYDVDHFVLTAFVYTSDTDFDASGEYTGRISAECVVKAK